MSEDIVLSRSHQQAIEAAAKDPNVPKVYANGFINGVSQGDVVVLLHRNGEYVTMLNLSFTVAKTLAVKLGESIASLEARTGSTIMTTDETSGQGSDDAEK